MMANLPPDEHQEAQKLAYLKSLARGNGRNPPPYNLEAAVGDFCQAAGEVTAKRLPPRGNRPKQELAMDKPNPLIHRFLISTTSRFTGC